MSCPVWQQERKRAWKKQLRRRYPNGSRERHPTIEAPLDESDAAGIPLPNTDNVTTDVANAKRRTP